MDLITNQVLKKESWIRATHLKNNPRNFEEEDRQLPNNTIEARTE